MAMMTSTSGARRNELLHIGVVEQHLLRDRSLSASGISERLIPVQDRLRSSLDTIALDETSVMNVNRQPSRNVHSEVTLNKDGSIWSLKEPLEVDGPTT